MTPPLPVRGSHTALSYRSMVGSVAVLSSWLPAPALPGKVRHSPSIRYRPGPALPRSDYHNAASSANGAQDSAAHWLPIDIGSAQLGLPLTMILPLFLLLSGC